MTLAEFKPMTTNQIVYLINVELAKAEASHQLPSTTGYNQHFLEGEIYAFNLILNKLNRNKFI